MVVVAAVKNMVLFDVDRGVGMVQTFIIYMKRDLGGAVPDEIERIQIVEQFEELSERVGIMDHRRKLPLIKLVKG